MRKTFLACAGLVGVAASLAAAVPASAQRLENRGADLDDPIMLMAEQDLPRNQFMLDSSSDVELVRFRKPHDLELCNARPDPNSVDGTRRGYAIEASWDNDVAVIMPGNCLAFDAQRLKVKAAGNLPDNVILTGTVRVIR
ncbi:hypothetical protein [Novosphingobium sp.]|jgi:hypothetical protein|uniref:hypothetical protein n=1 Tax=Novosphingobium sp. TaxID=1874826 RepID=UPI002FDF8CB1